MIANSLIASPIPLLSLVLYFLTPPVFPYTWVVFATLESRLLWHSRGDAACTHQGYTAHF